MSAQPDAVIYGVTLERGTDGSYLAWVDEIPGCAVRAGSRAEVLARVPSTIQEFLAWAGASAASVIDVEVRREVESAVETEEDTEVLVDVDRQPLTNEEWTNAHAWLARSREELLSLLAAIRTDDLATTRRGTQRTIGEEVAHVGFVELMYAAWTFDLRTTHGLSDFLAWTRDAAAARMRALADQAGADLTSASWAGAPREEPWTPRKAARRLVWHELLHLRALERFARSRHRGDD